MTRRVCSSSISLALRGLRKRYSLLIYLPMDAMPVNLTIAGPVNLAGVGIDPDKAADLLSWTRKAPTVLISLGTIYNLADKPVIVMMEAIQRLLQQINVQVLWKLETLEARIPFLQVAMEGSSGRRRLEKWLDAEPASLLESGFVKAFVHHGGASSFHDALA